MVTVSSIFESLSGPAKAGRIMGVRTEHAVTMRQRGSIPIRYWQAIIDGTAGDPEPITLEALYEAHSGSTKDQIEGAAA